MTPVGWRTALQVACPFCQVRVGVRCITTRTRGGANTIGWWTTEPHINRMRLAQLDAKVTFNVHRRG